MKPGRFLILAAAMLPLAAWTDPQNGQDATQRADQAPGEQTSSAKPPDAQAEAMHRLGLALQMAAYGQRAKDPLMLLAAARLLKQTPTQDIKLDKETKPEPAAPPKPSPSASEGAANPSPGASEGHVDQSPSGGEGQPPKPPSSITPEGLIQLARELSNHNPAIEQLAREIEQEKPRGASGGPKSHNECVSGRTVDIYRIEFAAGQRGSVAVQGDGATDLDLYVYDPDGRLFREDTSPGDTCAVEGAAAKTGQFRIEVHNLGHRTNCYTVYTN
jgi:hypothetical protein